MTRQSHLRAAPSDNIITPKGKTNTEDKPQRQRQLSFGKLRNSCRSRFQVYRLLTGIALYIAVINWGTSRPRLRLLLAGTLMAGISLALIAPFLVEWIVGKLAFLPSSLYERFSLFLSDSIHSNVMAGQQASEWGYIPKLLMSFGLTPFRLDTSVPIVREFYLGFA